MRAVTRGLLAGAVGTAAMTGWQTLLPRLRGSSEDGGGGEQPTTDDERWEQAASPARAARVVLRGAGFDPPASWIPFLTNATHWGYGTAWGVAYALVRKRVSAQSLPEGLAFGLAVWVASYVQLVPLGVYEPPWRYSLATLAEDASYHVVYGVGVGAAYRALEP
jgi:uncharacterized membrane protein YagU involved in acid resistance